MSVPLLEKLKFMKCSLSENKCVVANPWGVDVSGTVLKLNLVFSVYRMCEARASVEA